MMYSTQLPAGEWRQTVQVRSKEIKQQTHLLCVCFTNKIEKGVLRQRKETYFWWLKNPACHIFQGLSAHLVCIRTKRYSGHLLSGRSLHDWLNQEKESAVTNWQTHNWECTAFSGLYGHIVNYLVHMSLWRHGAFYTSIPVHHYCIFFYTATNSSWWLKNSVKLYYSV